VLGEDNKKEEIEQGDEDGVCEEEEWKREGRLGEEQKKERIKRSRSRRSPIPERRIKRRDEGEKSKK
jgi:hypothetical protein